ncbi:MAG: DNA-binding protein [Sediminibacterium sp.]|nr:DNA-binding protein [Sediminibacterium sp.]
MQHITKDDLKTLRLEIIEELKNILVNQKQTNPEFLRSSQAKKLLDCSDSKLETLRKNGTLSYTKIGGTIYYNNSDISKLFLN